MGVYDIFIQNYQVFYCKFLMCKNQEVTSARKRRKTNSTYVK